VNVSTLINGSRVHRNRSHHPIIEQLHSTPALSIRQNTQQRLHSAFIDESFTIPKAAKCGFDQVISITLMRN
jgi:hypothetical protein